MDEQHLKRITVFADTATGVCNFKLKPYLEVQHRSPFRKEQHIRIPKWVIFQRFPMLIKSKAGHNSTIYQTKVI